MHDAQTELTDLDAHALSAAIHAREVSCRDVMQAYLARIHRLNPRFNAIVNLAPDEQLLKQADACDAELARGHSRGWLHGIPQAIKDTGRAEGFPTTYGSVLLQDAVATSDSIMTRRMKAAGCIVIGKTNMPEFGLGSHTFNDLFGPTPNAWDTRVSAGGSSGGAAVAVAQRLLPVADGSDFMGSLRNPAGWNHIFGLRPSQGRVPFGPSADVWIDQLGTEGPMARSVRDLGRLLTTQAGPDRQAPLATHAPLSWPQAALPLKGLRIGWLGDLKGHLATEAGILDICRHALQHLAGEGADVAEAAFESDPEQIWNCWLTWRRALIGPRIDALMGLPQAREKIKPEALWEHDCAMRLSFADFAKASQVRTRFYQEMCALFERFDLLALPVAQVWPFPIAQRWPQAIGARTMDTYHRWMECTLYATLAGLPALSAPAGFHATEGWPMGIQFIGPPLGDDLLLRFAQGYEDLHAPLLAQRPPATA